MAHQQDVYGNPTTTHHTVITGGGQTDQYGNPIPQTAGGGTGMHIPGAGGHVLHRSGSSSSSSSSEDDGQGGRRKKKGMKEKIKEKIPGMGHKDEQKHTSATTTPGHGQHQQHKGMMDKIKDKLPGSHGQY